VEGDEGAVLEGIGSLVDKHLLLRGGGNGAAPRLTMLETVREYAAERLEAEGDAGEVRRRHAVHFADLAEEGERNLYQGRWQSSWAARLDAESDNMRAALRWCREAGEAELQLRLASALWLFWLVRGYPTEGRRWLEDALARAGGAPSPVRGRALAGAGVLAYRQGDMDRAGALFAEGLEVYRSLGDPVGTARMLGELGNVAVAAGDTARALALYGQSSDAFRELGERERLARVLQNMGVVAAMDGDIAEGLALSHEALLLQRELGQNEDLPVTLHNMGRLEMRRGERLRARELLVEAIERARETGYREIIAYCLEAFGEIAAADGEPGRGARLLGAGEGLFEQLAVPMQEEEQASFDRTLTLLREELGDGRLAAEMAAGRGMTVDDAIAEALVPAS
jgi:tetratricopeptide (TPR) repeat protein